MREETDAWLAPMMEAADQVTPERMRQLMSAATMPAAETDSPTVEQLARHSEHVRGIDWVRFGQLLRHELGWDDTYPAFPDFPESRDEP